jgi:hypothetical protein
LENREPDFGVNAPDFRMLSPPRAEFGGGGRRFSRHGCGRKKLPLQNGGGGVQRQDGGEDGDRKAGKEADAQQHVLKTPMK